jgi:hypothetical protein
VNSVGTKPLSKCATRKDGKKQVDSDAPPPPGIFMDEDGDEYIYTCPCIIHKSIVEIPSLYCDKCQTNVVVWKHQKMADDALETLMNIGTIVTTWKTLSGQRKRNR